MLYMPKTQFTNSVSRELAPNSALIDEGVGLVSAVGGKVTVGTGLADEKFVGVAVFQRGPILQMPFLVDGTSEAGGKVKLVHTPLGGVITVRNKATGAALTVTTDYTFNATTNEVTFVNAGVNYVISGEYSPTTMEARAIQGDVQPGGTVPQNYTFTGVIERGDVYTSWFETADDWTNPNAVIRLGANGKFTTQGSGAVVDAYVINVPSAEMAWLGLCLK